MKTIKELIRESLTEVAATKDIRRQDSIKRVYKQFPELKDIDDQILWSSVLILPKKNFS